MRRKNAQKLIAAGAVVTVGTDNYWAAAAEFSRTPKPETQDHGIGTILAIEGLVELGMTPAQATGRRDAQRRDRVAQASSSSGPSRPASARTCCSSTRTRSTTSDNIRKCPAARVIADGRVVSRRIATAADAVLTRARALATKDDERARTGQR